MLSLVDDMECPMRTQRTTSAFNPSSLLHVLTASLLLAATTTIGATSARVDGHDARISVTAVAGEVDVTMAGEPARVQTDSTLALPARIVTGNDGLLGFTQAGTNVTVASDSDVEVPAEAVDGNLIARLVQHRGNVFYDVAKRDVGKLRVETPLLVAVIKGTQFNVTVGPESTAISLFEGRLEIRTPDGSDVVQLQAGEIAIRSLVDNAIRVVGMNDLRVEARGAAARRAVDTALTPAARGLLNADDLRSPTAGAAAANVAPKSDLGELDLRATTPTVRAGDDGAALELETEAGAATVTTGLDLGVGTAAVAIDAGLDLGAGGATVTLDSRVDLGGAGVGASAAASIDLGAASAGVALDAGVDLGAASVGATADVGLDLSGGDVAVDAGVDLGVAGATVDADVGAELDLGADGATVGVDASADLGGVDAGLDLALDTGGGVDLGAAVEVGPLALDLDAGLDLGGVLDLGLETEEESTDTTDNEPSPPPPLLPRLLGGLL
jgi:hypothetical protein